MIDSTYKNFLEESIAIGQTVADGSVYSHIGDLTTADIPKVVEWLDGNVTSWNGWAKEIIKFCIQ